MSDSAILTAAPLFDSISPEDLASMLSCLDARRRDFQREEIIFPEGESIAHIGLVLAGAVHIVKEDYWGRRTLMASIGPGECFGEAYACSPASPFPFTAVAAESASILFLNIHRVSRPADPQSSHCPGGQQSASGPKNRVHLPPDHPGKAALLPLLPSQALPILRLHPALLQRTAGGVSGRGPQRHDGGTL